LIAVRITAITGKTIPTIVFVIATSIVASIMAIAGKTTKNTAVHAKVKMNAART
jgi:hypothetical protein